MRQRPSPSGPQPPQSRARTSSGSGRSPMGSSASTGRGARTGRGGGGAGGSGARSGAGSGSGNGVGSGGRTGSPSGAASTRVRCRRCGETNPTNITRCTVCGGDLPPAPRARGTAPAAAPRPAPGPAPRPDPPVSEGPQEGITCRSCTLMNAPGARRCDACGAALPSAAEILKAKRAAMSATEKISEAATSIDAVEAELKYLAAHGEFPESSTTPAGATPEEAAKFSLRRLDEMLTRAALDLDNIEVNADSREKRRAQFRRIDKLEAAIRFAREGVSSSGAGDGAPAAAAGSAV